MNIVEVPIPCNTIYVEILKIGIEFRIVIELFKLNISFQIDQIFLACLFFFCQKNKQIVATEVSRIVTDKALYYDKKEKCFFS